jgi:hypothetical protein
MRKHPSYTVTALAWCFTGLAGLQMVASGATLTNRYSFNETSGSNAVDSVSGQNGTLMNSATFSGTGQAIIAPTYGQLSGDATGPYIALPPNLMTNYSAVTMEAWLTPTLDDALGGAFWARVWDFGSSDGINGVNSFIYSRVGNDSFAVLADSFTAATGDSWCFTAATMLNGQENHFVWTADPANNIAHVYLNGVVVGTTLTFTNSPAIVGSTTNDWLGRSQFRADPYINAAFDEFRIYSGTLSPFEIAANFQNGPDVYPASYGTINGLQLQIATPIGLGNSAPATVHALASGLTNTLNISLNPEIAIAFSSANTNIAKVDASGNVTGVASGTVNIVATYSGVSATQAVQVIALPTTMIHRYSFNDGTANDSIGGVNGTFYNISGTSSITNNQLNLSGLSGDYVDLGPNVITPTNIPNNAITFEAWMTAFPANGAWTRLFDFGNIVGNLGANYFFYAPNTGANGGNSRLAVSDSSPGYLNESGFNVGNVLGQTNLHVVAVFNPNPSRQFLGLYLNGRLVGSTGTATKTLATINNVYSFLGRSLYSGVGDAWLAGSIDEFRIYNGELDRFQIAASDQAGPDHTNFNVGTFTSMSLNPGGATMPVDTLRQGSVIINFSLATNVSLLGDANLTITSSDTNIVTMSRNSGIVRTFGLGTATLNATYNYIVGATTNTYTASASITTYIAPATMAHRYSFNEGAGLTVHDSIGGADGTILAATNTLVVTNFVWAPAGQLMINTNTTLGAQDTFVNLPAGIVSALVSNATFEMWATEQSSAGWQRLFDFGGFPGSPTNAASPNVFLTRGPGNTFPRYDWVSGNINAPTSWTNGVEDHFVITHDGTDGSAKMYINGVLAASSAAQNEPLSSITDTNCYLGRSLYSWPNSLPGGFFDPYTIGSFDEFRIYRGLLTQAEVQQDYLLGPDALISPAVSAAVSGANVVISWPTYGAHFTLQSSPALGSGASWADVAVPAVQVGATYQVTLPHSGTAQFFRLHRQ